MSKWYTVSIISIVTFLYVDTILKSRSFTPANIQSQIDDNISP